VFLAKSCENRAIARHMGISVIPFENARQTASDLGKLLAL